MFAQNYLSWEGGDASSFPTCYTPEGKLTSAVALGGLSSGLEIEQGANVFVSQQKDVVKYLQKDMNWDIPASKALQIYPQLVIEIADDMDITPFVYDIKLNGKGAIDFAGVIEKLKNISQNKPYAVNITKHNIVEIFNRFEKDVIKDKKYKEVLIFNDEKRISNLVSLFFTCLTSPKDVYLHPKKKNVIVVKGKDIRINTDSYKSIFSHNLNKNIVLKNWKK